MLFWAKKRYIWYKRVNFKNHHRIHLIFVKIQMEQRSLIFWAKFALKVYFQSKAGKNKITTECSMLALV